MLGGGDRCPVQPEKKKWKKNEREKVKVSVSNIKKPLKKNYKKTENQSAGNVLTSTYNELDDESNTPKSYTVPTLIQAQGQKGVIFLSVI